VTSNIFDEDNKPTEQQRLWGQAFLAFWHLVQQTGRGGGKTWFWKQVIKFIELQEPWVKE
jgi:hypothetical protein